MSHSLTSKTTAFAWIIMHTSLHTMEHNGSSILKYIHIWMMSIRDIFHAFVCLTFFSSVCYAMARCPSGWLQYKSTLINFYASPKGNCTYTHARIALHSCRTKNSMLSSGSWIFLTIVCFGSLLLCLWQVPTLQSPHICSYGHIIPARHNNARLSLRLVAFRRLHRLFASPIETAIIIIIFLTDFTCNVLNANVVLPHAHCTAII